jgi:serine/threonine protein kinase
MVLSKQRQCFLQDASLSCFPFYEKTGVLLGKGSSAIVIEVKKDSHSFAAKLVQIKSEKQRDTFKREIINQENFYPKAPKIFYSAIDTFPECEIGIIIMERIAQTLDQSLVYKKSCDHLKQVILDLSQLLEFLKYCHFVHGDLALFNLGYVRRNKRKELIFIDFGDSSIVKSIFHHFSELDALRLILELFPNHHSEGTAPIEMFNSRYLRLYGIPVFLVFASSTCAPIDSPDLWDNRWIAMYTNYCSKAGLAGLG